MCSLIMSQAMARILPLAKRIKAVPLTAAGALAAKSLAVSPPYPAWLATPVAFAFYHTPLPDVPV